MQQQNTLFLKKTSNFVKIFNFNIFYDIIFKVERLVKVKVIKIQTYKNSLIFSFKEQEKLDTNLTMITTKINLEEVYFSFKYIVKNKKLILKFLKDTIISKNITKIVLADYELFDLVFDLIPKLNQITSLEIRDKTVLDYEDCLKVMKLKQLKEFKCFSIPLFMLEQLDKTNLEVSLFSEEFYVSNFMLDNKFNNYADMYYAKTIVINKEMNETDLNDFKTFLRINKYLKVIYLYYYKKELVQKLLTILDSLNVKKIKFKIYQQDKDNNALEELANYINKNKIKKLSYSFKIIYSKEYIHNNFVKQLSFTNLKMCALIMIITLACGIGFKIYYDFKAQEDVEDVYDMVNLINEVDTDANEEQKQDEGEQKQVIEALTEDFDKLLAINPDTVGWLKVNNTNVNYPVVHTDNNDYYLNYNFYKRKNFNGWVFMDYRNSIEELNDNTIIYGHNGTMFGSLKNTLKEKWYTNKNNQIISFNTLYAQLRFQIFAIYITTPDFDYIINNYVYPQNYTKFLAEVKSRSIYDFGVEVTNEDKILTLSTCAENGAKRIVIHAKLI